MIVAPLLINSSDTIVRFLFSSAWDQESVNLHAILVEIMDLDGHTLIIGFGARGQNISRILTEENKTYHALDLDVERVTNARLAGESVSFGDEKRTEVLQAAGLDRAKMVIITLSNMHESEQILNTIMLLNPTKSVVVRVTDDDYINVFARMGADDVVSDSKESSLALAAEAMLALGMSYRHVHNIVSKVRRDHYQVLAGVFKGHDDAIDFEDESSQTVRYAFILPPDSKAVGMKVSELPIDKEKVSLISIRRRAFQIRNPVSDFVLEADDTLVLVGAKGWVNSFESWALMGE
ncbi:NEM-activable K(+)/H(+) antiporter [Oligella ureolytica]|nr:NEM-activable K(+)/H(+) antiporter [Oligella ureolytica]